MPSDTHVVSLLSFSRPSSIASVYNTIVTGGAEETVGKTVGAASDGWGWGK